MPPIDLKAGWRAVALVALLAACRAPMRPAAWPESAEANLARGWVEAFSSGEEAMRRFASDHFAASSLAARGPEERMATYRFLRDRLGTLRLAGVVDAGTAGELTVKLVDAHDEEHDFTFRFEAGEPRKLAGVTARLTSRHGFGLFGHGP